MTRHDHTRRLLLAMQAGVLTRADQREATDLLYAYVVRAKAIERDRDRIVDAAREDAERAERHARGKVVPLRGWPRPFVAPEGAA